MSAKSTASRASGQSAHSPPSCPRPPGGHGHLRRLGDLTHRKILPALARLADRGVLDDGFTVIGVARTEWTDEEFRSKVTESTPDCGPKWKALVERFKYVAGEYDHPDTFSRLKAHLDEADKLDGTDGNRLYYLATIRACSDWWPGPCTTTPAPAPRGRLLRPGGGGEAVRP